MKFPFIENPKTKRPDEMVTVTVLTVSAVLIRFLVDGLSISILGHTLQFGHIDAMVYAALLTPVLGAHSYMDGKKETKKEE